MTATEIAARNIGNYLETMFARSWRRIKLTTQLLILRLYFISLFRVCGTKCKIY